MDFSSNLRYLADEEKRCTKDEDCMDHPWFQCGVKKEGVCSHKEVFPIYGLEVAGLAVFSLIMALANIAGIGGGGIAIPVLIAFFYFTTKTAIAISSFSIFLTTLARFVMNFKERHPDKPNAVVIDYDLVTIMMPTNLAGAQIGALILVVFPSLIIQIILTLTLLALGIQSTFKAIEITKKENRLKQEKLQQQQDNNIAKVKPVIESDAQDQNIELSHQPVLQQSAPVPEGEAPRPRVYSNGTTNDADSHGKTPGGTPEKEDGAGSDQNKKKEDQEVDTQRQMVAVEKEEVEYDITRQPTYDKVLKQCVPTEGCPKELKRLRRSLTMEMSHGQWAKQALCIVLLLALILMNLAMGSKNMDSIFGIKKCSAWYWNVQGIFVAICIICTIIAVKLAQRDQNLKLKYGGLNVADSDIRYSSKKSLTYLLLLGFAGGWVAGALGLGGGSIYNPALLAMGIPPKVSSATGLYLVTFSKIASVLVYFLDDLLDIPYGLWIGFWSCFGMVLGLCMAQCYMKKTGRQSIIVWVLVFLLFVSTIAIPIFGGISLQKEADEGKDLMAFQDICTAED